METASSTTGSGSGAAAALGAEVAPACAGADWAGPLAWAFWASSSCLNWIPASKPMASICLKPSAIMWGTERAFGRPAPSERPVSVATCCWKLLRMSSGLMLMMSSSRIVPGLTGRTVQPDLLQLELVAERLDAEESAQLAAGCGDLLVLLDDVDVLEDFEHVLH